MLKETHHDYQGCITGNYYDKECTVEFKSWTEFKDNWVGFMGNKYDDTYHFVFRYDIHKEDEKYILELCIMLQRKGIYVHLYIYDIDEELLNSEVNAWLRERSYYIENLWGELK